MLGETPVSSLLDSPWAYSKDFGCSDVPKIITKS